SRSRKIGDHLHVGINDRVDLSIDFKIKRIIVNNRSIALLCTQYTRPGPWIFLDMSFYFFVSQKAYLSVFLTYVSVTNHIGDDGMLQLNSINGVIKNAFRVAYFQMGNY